ncbi:MAG: MFS transporter [Anaerolineales bacterium]|nr:MFS transporter [Anaerolineales bacterium]
MASRRSFRVQALLELDKTKDIDPTVSRFFRRNFIANALDLTFFSFGESLANPRTILPVFASTLTTSPFLIGLIPILNDVGWSLPQIFFSRFSARLKRKLPTVLALGVLERLPFLLFGLLALQVMVLPANTAVILLLLAVSLRSFSAGAVGLPWQEMIANIIPAGRRGSFFGTGFLLGQIAGIAGSGIVAYLLAEKAYPEGYAISFFAAFGAMIVSWFLMCLTKEPDQASTNRGFPQDQKYGLQGAVAILKENQNFRRYLISRGLFVIGFMAMAYLAVYAVQSFHLSEEYAAIFSGVMLGGALIGNIAGAALSDRHGSKTALLLATVIWAAALVVALLAASWEVFLLVFFLLGMSNSANTVGDLSIAMDFSTGADRPVYVGTARSMAGFITLPTPFVAGLLIRAGGYSLMMGVALVFVLLSMFVLWRFVREPRQA